MSFDTMEKDDIAKPVKKPRREVNVNIFSKEFEATAMPTITANPTIMELAGRMSESQSLREALGSPMVSRH